MKPPPYVANFDSATAMLRANARFLHGEDFPALGLFSRPMLPVMRTLGAVVNALPRRLQEEVFTWSGWGEAVGPKSLASVDSEALDAWMTSEYPEREYQAVMVGSSNGALTHLCAALGIPFLPQTSLVPVARHGAHPDEPKEDLAFGREHAGPMLVENPDLALHHQHDANQDRLMIRHMTYFRVKRRTLGQEYRRFIEATLPPGGTILVSECELRWPTYRVGERHYFQIGALGGVDAEEFVTGSERIAEYLERYGSHTRRWDYPPVDEYRTEAEWGFDGALLADIEHFAAERGYRVRRIRYENPEDASEFVADLYAWWYRRRGIRSRRLVVGSFVQMEPHWTLRTGSIPFWMVFNKEPSAEALEDYIDSRGPFDDIFAMLFNHGVESVGLVPIERWCELLSRARRRCGFLGTDERSYPLDFASMTRYSRAVRTSIPSRYPLPGPLTLDLVDEFAADSPHAYHIEWAAARGS